MTGTRSLSAKLLGGFLPPLRTGRLRLLLLGQLTSRTGDLVFLVALASYALALDPPGSLLAVILLAQTAGTLMMLILSGTITDRVGARAVLLTADVVRAGALTALAFHALADGHVEWLLVLAGATMGIGDGLFEPSFALALAQVTTEETRIGANALKSVIWRSAAVAGAAIGGVAVSWLGAGTAFTVAAVGFLVSATTVVRMGRWSVVEAGGGDSVSRVLSGIREGLAYLRSVPWILALIGVSGVVTSLVMSPARALLPLALTDNFGTATHFSTLLVVEAISGLAAGLVIGRHAALPRRGTVAVVGMALYCTGYLVASQSHSILLSAAALATGAVAVTAATVAYVSILQTYVPERYLGRVAGFDALLTIGGAPVVLGAIPLLSAAMATSLLLAVASGTALTACLSTLFYRRVRSL